MNQTERAILELIKQALAAPKVSRASLLKIAWAIQEGTYLNRRNLTPAAEVRTVGGCPAKSATGG